MTCSICFFDHDRSVYYLEGHRAGQTFHVFDSSCIRKWLNIKQNCPLCREPLSPNDLIKVPNPRFSRIRWLVNPHQVDLWLATGVAATMVALRPNIIGGGLLLEGEKKMNGHAFVGSLIKGCYIHLSSAMISIVPCLVGGFRELPECLEKNIGKIQAVMLATTALLALQFDWDHYETATGILSPLIPLLYLMTPDGYQLLERTWGCERTHHLFFKVMKRSSYLLIAVALAKWANICPRSLDVSALFKKLIG